MERLTRISFPVEVVLGIAMALVVNPCLLACWAVGEGYVVVGDVVEEVNFLFLQHETCGDGMDGGISPSLVEEPTILVESLKIIRVCLRSEPVKVTDLEVRPLHFVSYVQRYDDAQNLPCGNGCKILHHHHSKTPWSCPQQYALGVPS